MQIIRPLTIWVQETENAWKPGSMEEKARKKGENRRRKHGNLEAWRRGRRKGKYGREGMKKKTWRMRGKRNGRIEWINDKKGE